MLYSFFAGKIAAGQGDTHGAPEAIDLSQEITRASEKADLIKRVFDGHCLMTIALSGIDDIYTSAIIEFIPEQGYIVLDELSPEGGHH
jgi:hypothetical protein